MEQLLLKIDAQDLTLGESVSTRLADKGFSPESYGVNVSRDKGYLYFQEAETDRSGAVLVDDIIAGEFDATFLGNDQYMVDESGNFYTLDGTTLTKKQTDSTNTYTIGTTDLITFQSEVFTTSTQDIAKLTSNMAALDEDWWTNTRSHAPLSGSYRHPMEVVEDTLYIADQYYLHTWDGTTSVYNAMSLPPDVNITSLRKHPDGRHLIAFCGVTANYSHTLGGGGKIYIIDTTNLEWIREIDEVPQVEGSRVLGGVVYVTYGRNFGYFTGDGVEWLKDLNQGTTYSHNMRIAEDILLIRDSTQVLAYGDLGQGKVFWRTYNPTSATVVTYVGYKGNNIVLVGYHNGTSPKIVEYNLNSAGVAGQFESNLYKLSAEYAIRRIEIDHDKTTDSGTNSFVITLLDADDDTLATETKSYTDNPHKTSEMYFDTFTRDLRLRLAPSAGALGFRQIRIYGENIE